MNTILTDDEVIAIKRSTKIFDTNPWAESRSFARAIEAVVLAKLREQEPYGWVSMGQLRYTPPKADPETYVLVYLRPMPAAPLPAVVQIKDQA